MEGAVRWYRRGHTALPLWLAAATVLLLAAAPPPAAAQMISPLAGQNSPGLNTTEVFMSAYLDRLLEGGWWWGAVRTLLLPTRARLRWRQHMPGALPGPKCAVAGNTSALQWMRRTTGTARFCTSSSPGQWAAGQRHTGCCLVP